MTTVERVARALTKRCGVDPDDTNGGTWDGGSYSRGKPAWNCWTDDARAAIEAMGEPTPFMLKTLEHQKITDYGEGNAYLTEENIVWNWQVMLTAALAEPSNKV